MTVLDASVCVALFKADEAEHGACRVWLDEAVAAGEDLAAPSLLLAEVGAALGRGVGDPLLAARAVALLESGRLVKLHAVTDRLGSRAASLAIDQRLRGADAIYVALAEHLDAPLLTLDRQQRERSTGVIEARWPLDE